MYEFKQFIINNQIMLYVCFFVGLVLATGIFFYEYIKEAKKNKVYNENGTNNEITNQIEKPTENKNVITVETKPIVETEQMVNDPVSGYKLEILLTEDKVYYYRIKNKDDEVICKSRDYSTRTSCVNGMMNLRNYVLSEILDITAGLDLDFKKKFGKAYFYIMIDPNKKYCFKLVNQNNYAQLESGTFSKKSDCVEILNELKTAEFFKLNLTIA